MLDKYSLGEWIWLLFWGDRVSRLHYDRAKEAGIRVPDIRDAVGRGIPLDTYTRCRRHERTRQLLASHGQVCEAWDRAQTKAPKTGGAAANILLAYQWVLGDTGSHDAGMQSIEND